MKNKILFFVFAFLFVLIWAWFYYINSNNYVQIKIAQEEIVKHPENLPKKEMANYTSFWYANLRADIYWLEAIQYIWWNALKSEYKKYLYKMLDLITELNPYFEKPYIIGQLLLPNYNDRYENLTNTEVDNYIKEWEEIWLKWIKNFCNMQKINEILKEDDLEKIWSEEKYKNPCISGTIAFNQWFLYYFYLKDSLKASDYYKIASANEDSLEWAKVMAAIMKWKWWDREKSIMMFLTLAKSSWENNESCSIFSDELEKVSYATFRNWIELSWDIIKNIEDLRKEYFEFNPDNEEELVLKDDCSNYINKWVRELNLHYIEEANKKYLKDTWENAKNAKELYDKWYIDFLPTDFQQYDDYWIIYEYDNETWNFDYEMGNY